MGVTMQQHGAEEGRVGGWYLFPPPPDYVDELKRQEKFLLISDAGGTNSESFSVNVMGMAIGLIILLFFVQLAMPGIRQVGTSSRRSTAPTPPTAWTRSADTTPSTETTVWTTGDIRPSTETLKRLKIC